MMAAQYRMLCNHFLFQGVVDQICWVIASLDAGEWLIPHVLIQRRILVDHTTQQLVNCSRIKQPWVGTQSFVFNLISTAVDLSRKIVNS